MRSRLRPFTVPSLLLLGAALLTHCRRDARPLSPLASDFEMFGMNGTRMKAADLKGKPWVINFWIPG